MIATIVRVPHRILIGAGHLPGYLIPARRLLRANRHPVAAKLVKLTVYNRRPTIAQFDRRPAIRIKKIMAPPLNHADRSKCLDRSKADQTGAVPLLVYLILALALRLANRPLVAAKLVKLTVYNRRPTIAQFDRRPAIRI